MMKKNNEFHFYAILLAAGKSSRLEKTNVKKQFLSYLDAPLWWESAKKFYASPHIKGIVLVFPDNDEEFSLACEEAIKLHAQNNIGIPFIYTKGGEKRHDSVFCALQALPPSCSHVLIHDSARPFFSTRLVHTLVSAFKTSQNIYAIIPAITVTDTIKIISNLDIHQCIHTVHFDTTDADTNLSTTEAGTRDLSNTDADTTFSNTINSKQITDGRDADIANEALIYEKVEKTLERKSLRAVQTPQAFSVHELINAHKKIRMLNNPDIINEKQNVLTTQEITDDAMLMEHAGHTVYVIEGEADNIKITHTKDLQLLQNPIQKIPCSGYGYDVHRFGGNRPFILGGISIPTPLQIDAHSDGDVLLHALMDALLSCMCLGDIGTHFPDNDPKYHNISSSLLLDHVMDLWKKSSLSLCHVDLTVITQKPQISPFAKEISKNVARLLSISTTCVNTKATTEEKLGFTGKGLGIKAIALVSALKTVEN